MIIGIASVVLAVGCLRLVMLYCVLDIVIRVVCFVHVGFVFLVEWFYCSVYSFGSFSYFLCCGVRT
jgi:hypothetical protein